MREIEFRGKRLDNGGWIFGNLKRVDRTLFSKPTEPSYFIVPFEPSERSFRVEPDTVGQYSGLKDKNGVKIFEGDILGFYDIGEQRKSAVEFKDGAFRVEDWGEKVVLTEELIHSFVVVHVEGNIHDNPELLEVE